MTTAFLNTKAADLSADDYLVLGLATCFLKAEGEVHQVFVVEPIPSAALEALIKGIPTSYRFACATTLGAVLPSEVPQLPADFPPDAQFCDDFVERSIAAARTYKTHPVTQSLIPQGTTHQDFNYSVERKRVLNSQHIVRTEDNVKQHEYTHKTL